MNFPLIPFCTFSPEAKTGSAIPAHTPMSTWPSNSRYHVPVPSWTDYDDVENQEIVYCLPRIGEVELSSEEIVPYIKSLQRTLIVEDWYKHIFSAENWTEPQENIFKRIDAFGQHARRVLGRHAESRLGEFIEYQKGWDSGKGEPLSSVSIALVDFFVNMFSDFGQTPPSLFLTRNGNLQLGWEDREGSPMEVEFCPDRIEFYNGRTGEEGEVSIDPEVPIEALELTVEKLS